MKLKIYGSKGSMPFFSRNSLVYGGNTSCVRVDTAGHTVILDCGSGLMEYNMELQRDAKSTLNKPLKADILISHLHVDHIIGLCAFAPIWNPQNDIRIFTKSRNSLPLAEQVFGIFKPPYWPTDITQQNRARLVEINDTDDFMLTKDIKVTPFAAQHHNGTTAFRLQADKSLVYLLDYEVDASSENFNELVSFCKNADMIIFDCAYLPKDYPARRGWGHSTYETGILLAEKSACGQMLLSHFSQDYDDKTLDYLASCVNDEKFLLAFDGKEIEL